MRDPLTRVRRATARRDAAETEWRDAIRAAAEDNSLRAVGEAAGVSHVRVLQIVRKGCRESPMVIVGIGEQFDDITVHRAQVRPARCCSQTLTPSSNQVAAVGGGHDRFEAELGEIRALFVREPGVSIASA